MEGQLRDFKEFNDETTIINKFEEYEDELGTNFGLDWEDFGEWFLIFRAGFLAGGNS